MHEDTSTDIGNSIQEVCFLENRGNFYKEVWEEMIPELRLKSELHLLS